MNMLYSNSQEERTRGHTSKMAHICWLSGCSYLPYDGIKHPHLPF